MKNTFFVCLLLVLASALGAQDRRAALVVGNSAYASNALVNPVNDAGDVAAALREAGFEVALVTNADIAGFEKAISDFAGSLKGADTGLFYYAGHGVSVDGMNYLIPVSPRIDDAASVKAKAVAVDTIIGKMESAGLRTALVFLDSCRDNPFPGASRSGARGLAVVATPRTMNSLIAYATSPGATAADGDGRNGVFSGAVVRQLRIPGQELTVLMRNVKAEVAATTNNKQQPRVDDGMKEPFFFVSPEASAARAQAALDRSKAEIAELERQLAERQSRISATSDAASKQALELDQQRQQALQAAKKLETDNLAWEAERQKQAAEEAHRIALQRQASDQAARCEQSELGNLAAARRAELEKLAYAGGSDNPDVLIETVERLDAVLKEVDGQYAAALQKSQASSNAAWNQQLAALSNQKPDITETDAEFAARISKEKAAQESKRQAELDKLRAEAETQRMSQTADMRRQFNDTLRTLEARTWTLAGSSVALTVGAFDRNARTWPFTVNSKDKTIPILPVELTARLNESADPVAAIRELDAAVKAKALAAELDWGLTRDAAKKRYGLDILAVRVRNLTSNAVVVQARPRQRAAYFEVGKRSAPTAAVGTLAVSTKAGDGQAEVYAEGVKLGTTPLTVKLAEGTFNLELRWADDYGKHFSQAAAINSGQTTTINAAKPVLSIGDRGPAGGIVFYVKGKVSDGWRYLEAAPSDSSAGLQWNNDKYITIKTGTSIGAGKANTVAIIAAQGSGSYAAQLCKELSLGGYSDWFLPSKDELNLLYSNLHKKSLGGFASGDYWSSSQADNANAYVQYFDGGYQARNAAYAGCRVRAVRAF